MALLAVLALVGSACGGSSESQAVPNTVVKPEWMDDQAPVDPVDEEQADQAEERFDEVAAELAADQSDDPVDEGDDSNDDAVPDVDEPNGDAADESVDEVLTDDSFTQVLAYALTAIEQKQSFSFTQGMRMDMSMMGMDIVMGGEDPLMYGTVDGGQSYGLIDMGTFITSLFESMDMGNEPGMQEVMDAFAGAQIEAWTDIEAGVIIYDMTSFSSVMAATDPAAAGEFGLFADGPVLIDMNKFDGNMADVMAQYGSGAQVIDPTQIAEVVRGLSGVDERGKGEVAGKAVTAYGGTVSMGEYSAALGQDLEDSLGGVGDLADDPMMNDMVAAMEDMLVDVVVMVDDEGLLRRIEITMDMSQMFEGMASADDEFDILGEMSLRLETWQEFDEYGDSFDWAPPADAVDMTSEFNEQMGFAFN